MSRTNRSQPFVYNNHREPHHKRALVELERSLDDFMDNDLVPPNRKAKPPTNWDDLPVASYREHRRGSKD